VTTAPAPPHQTVLEIRASRGWRALDLRELWAYRELLVIFAWRDIKVRYRQTILGAAWVMGQPLLTMLIFTLVFNRIAKFNAPGVPYPVFVLAGVLIWTFVSSTISHAGNSLIGASFLISKVYFPRLAIPLSNVMLNVVDFGVGIVLLAGVMVWYRVVPGVTIVFLPFVILVAALFALGIGLWVAAANVEYRDVRVIIPFALQLAMYATPVVYPMAALPPAYRRIAVINPMTGIVEAFRASLFGTPMPGAGALAWSVVASLLCLIGGAFYFRRMERLFADVI
jgi:lipopolysaccharide transport system permease protein